MTKLTVAFCNFVSTPKNCRYIIPNIMVDKTGYNWESVATGNLLLVRGYFTYTDFLPDGPPTVFQ
jgi:hypothetical protein